MKKYVVLAIMLLATVAGRAHSPASSTMVLAEQEDRTWTLQVRASLDAFRKEVKMHFSDSPYESPAEFQEQVLRHFRNTLRISVNHGQEIIVDSGAVMLGHETTVFFDNISLPEDMETIEIVGSMFKDIYRSKIRLLILKEGVEQKSVFTLSQDNGFTKELMIQQDQVVGKEVVRDKLPWWSLLTPLYVLLAMSFVAFLAFNKRSVKVS